jgi:hypothetical protein
VRVDRRDLNLFVVRDTKGQPGIERELVGATLLKLSAGGDLWLDSQDLEGPIGEVVLGVR